MNGITPPQPIDIVEVIGPSEQGMAVPYVCRGEDGLLYYVKHRQSGSHSLWAEWICGHLALAFGLNLPQFRLVCIDQALLDECPPAWHDLGAGIGFGSEQHPVASWLEPAMAADVTPQVQQDIALFDWWVHNMDRTTGNTNLLWSPQQAEAVVIDFNNAFDPTFDEAAFMATHLFASQLPGCFDDLVTRDEYATRMAFALSTLPAACDNLPLEWRWINPEMDIPTRFDLEACTRLLQRSLDGQPWGPK
jgi:hypothetical protein